MPKSKKTNRKLVKRYNKVKANVDKLVDWFCDNEMGHLKPSDMRAMVKKPKQVTQYISFLDELSDLKGEAQSRYGSDLIFVTDLLNQK